MWSMKWISKYTEWLQQISDVSNIAALNLECNKEDWKTISGREPFLEILISFVQDAAHIMSLNFPGDFKILRYATKVKNYYYVGL
jgi:hypothetical protein